MSLCSLTFLADFLMNMKKLNEMVFRLHLAILLRAVNSDYSTCKSRSTFIIKPWNMHWRWGCGKVILLLTISCGLLSCHLLLVALIVFHSCMHFSYTYCERFKLFFPIRFSRTREIGLRELTSVMLNNTVYCSGYIIYIFFVSKWRIQFYKAASENIGLCCCFAVAEYMPFSPFCKF